MVFFIPSVFDASHAYLIDSLGWPEGLFMGVAFVGTIASIFFPLCLFLEICYHFNLFKEQRIVRPTKRKQTPGLVRRAWLHSIALHLSVIFTFDPWYRLMKWRGIDMTSPITDFSIGTILYHLAVAVAFEDTLFYWVHLLLHHRRIYKYIHKVHHRFALSEGITAVFAHPIESVVGVIIPLFTGPIVTGAPASIMLLWAFLRVWESVDGHSGYTFKWSPWEAILSLQGGAERHDFHHSRNVGCYGSLTKFWDWAMGTDKAFNAWMEKKKHLEIEEDAH